MPGSIFYFLENGASINTTLPAATIAGADDFVEVTPWGGRLRGGQRPATPDRVCKDFTDPVYVHTRIPPTPPPHREYN